MPGLAKAAALFADAAGTPAQPGAVTLWTPTRIRERAATLTVTDARCLNASWRRAQEEDGAADRPSALLLLVGARPRMAAPEPSRQEERRGVRDPIRVLFLEVGQLASQPVWDNLVWLPQEQRWRRGGSAPDPSENPYAD